MQHDGMFEANVCLPACLAGATRFSLPDHFVCSDLSIINFRTPMLPNVSCIVDIYCLWKRKGRNPGPLENRRDGCQREKKKHT